MRLWTVQPCCVYELIQREGVYRCNPNLSEFIEFFDFTKAYKWLSEQMERRIGKPPEKVQFPVWAWHTVEGKHKRPDMRKSYMKVLENSVLLEIEVPDTEVLLTDFDMWHIVLNDSIYYKVNDLYMHVSSEEWDSLWEIETEKEDAFFNSLSYEEKVLYKEKSWEKVICSKEDTTIQCIQATFWELKKSCIKKAWFIKGCETS